MTIDAVTSARGWLKRIDGRKIVLALAALLSLPSVFYYKPAVEVDQAWCHCLQAAITGGSVFGRDFMFTYGPLGYLLARLPVNKMNLLLFDLFIACSLLSIYGRLLAYSAKTGWAVLVLMVAINTKRAFTSPEGILFVLLGYWLWRLATDDRFTLPLVASLASAIILFFSKANYGLVTLALLPAYGVGLIICRRSWNRAAWLLVGFVALLGLGAGVGRVDLTGYLRSSLALASGYSEAMFVARRPEILIGAALLVGVIITAILAQFRIESWRNWAMICPFLMLAVWLLYKNVIVRADFVHEALFFANMPLLLSLWTLASPSSTMARGFLVFFAFCGLWQIGVSKYSPDWFSSTPRRYAKGFWSAPWRQNGPELGAELKSIFPQMALPPTVVAAIGHASVDAMPLDSDLPMINGLCSHGRPVLQSYAAFTPWLDEQNARFLTGRDAPEFVIYVARNCNTLDERPAAWDESITKRCLLENYLPVTQFPMHGIWSFDQRDDTALTVVLRQTTAARAFEPISTNFVRIELGRPFAVPSSTNYEFLWLDVARSTLGKIEAAACQPAKLTASFEYNDGSRRAYRAVLPILKTGVLINYRVESPAETALWLAGKADANSSVRSLSFQSQFPWAFQPALQGKIVTYRLVQKRGPL